MRKEDFVSTLVMTTVSILMLVGVTIAWYTAVYAHPTVTGMQMTAQEQGSIKIALKSEGPDIAVLRENDIEGDEYAEIGLYVLTNIERGLMAPGAFGEVTFYITSLKQDITSCQVVPSLVPGYEEDFIAGAGYVDGVPENATVTINNTEKKIVDVLEEHFDFYADKNMTIPVSLAEPMEVELINESTRPWDEKKKEGTEVPVTIYWKWHYEDPKATAANSTMNEDVKKAAIYDYDMEDTWIGTHLDTMSFHFDFLIQE